MNTDLITTALSKYGLTEAPGVQDNPVILQMAKDAGFPDYNHDSIAWCSLFANWVAWKSGYQRSMKLNARSWLTIGQPVSNPELGDVVILWREQKAGELGHVGFFINQDTKGSIFLLAGNQADQVEIAPFPKERLLGFRRLAKPTVNQ